VTPLAVDASVLLATFNRARLLDETLSSLRRLRVEGLVWEVVVADNNSTDNTREVLARQAHDFPVPLRVVTAKVQGRSSALNAAIAEARGDILAFTDDDVRVAERWLASAVAPLRDPALSLAYTGGPVRPIWEAPPPAWLDLTRGDLWGTLALQDHGNAPMNYERARRVPLGANMAVRREVFERVGLFRPDLGRSAGRIVLGQEVPEWLLRVRRAGLTGLYVPNMEVHHHVPAARLSKRYFRRWWFGKGVSREALERVRPVTELGLDLRQTPHVLGVPRFMYGSLVRDLLGLLRERIRRQPAAAFRHEMMVVFFAGYFAARVGWLHAGAAGTPSSATKAATA
jgi:glycosyltransferase involved in cell wall biosynthesis